MIHDITASAGLGNFTGPVTYAMIAAGLAMALTEEIWNNKKQVNN